MAPGRPRITIGIQPNTAMFSLVAGSVCAFAWYTEKYRRDEAELEGHLRKLYFRDAQDSKERMPQMTAAIKGESMSLDGRMDKLVWGGKAQLKNKKPKDNNSSSSLSTDEHDDNNTDSVAVGSSNNEEKRGRRKRKKRKQKGAAKEEEKLKAEQAAQLETQQRRKLVLQSSVAGIAVGAVAVAAVTTILGGGKGRN